jgi:hypothetical protein
MSGAAYGGGWQAGLLTAGGETVSTPKQAYTAAAADWLLGRGACRSRQIAWAPTGFSPRGSGGGKTQKPGKPGKPDALQKPQTPAKPPKPPKPPKR